MIYWGTVGGAGPAAQGANTFKARCPASGFLNDKRQNPKKPPPEGGAT